MAWNWDIHKLCQLPESTKETLICKGSFEYFHYGFDSIDDRGWGCGYRTLQSICSGINYQKSHGNKNPKLCVPSILQIQEALVKIEDKPLSFKGSKEWIGTVEAAMVIDEFYDVPCKILHISSGSQIQDHVSEISDHFKVNCCPIMMGGNSDAASKAICGLCEADTGTSLLIMDPHYFGPAATVTTLVEKGYLNWRLLETFVHNSFYNLCMPQIKLKLGDRNE